MAKRKVWLTWMPDAASGLQPNELLTTLARYGLEPAGAAWANDLEKMAWTELAGQLLDRAGADAWVIAARREDLASRQNRYALSLLTAMVREGRDQPLSAWCVGLDFTPAAEGMPTMLRDFHYAQVRDAGWGARLVAAVHGRKALPAWDLRLNVIAHPMLGQWFEVGPREGEWRGAIFGVGGDGKITHQAVGPAGQLPEKTVLEYPTQGIQAEIGDTEFTAWSVQNRIGPEQSYYAKVDGHPARLLVGENPDADDAEVIVLDLS